jgi:hypothetical protein
MNLATGILDVERPVNVSEKSNLPDNMLALYGMITALSGNIRPISGTLTL